MEALQISLSGSVGVAHVAQLHATALEAISAGSSVTFNMSETRDIDASIVQLVLATRALTQSQGLETSLVGLSEMLSDSLIRYGAEELLELVRTEPLPTTPAEAAHPAEGPVSDAEATAQIPEEPAPERPDEAAAETSDSPDGQQPDQGKQPTAEAAEAVTAGAKSASDAALVAAANAFFGTDEGAGPNPPPDTAGTENANSEGSASGSGNDPQSTSGDATDLVLDSTTASEGMDE